MSEETNKYIIKKYIEVHYDNSRWYKSWAIATLLLRETRRLRKSSIYFRRITRKLFKEIEELQAELEKFRQGNKTLSNILDANAFLTEKNKKLEAELVDRKELIKRNDEMFYSQTQWLEKTLQKNRELEAENAALDKTNDDLASICNKHLATIAGLKEEIAALKKDNEILEHRWKEYKNIRDKQLEEIAALQQLLKKHERDKNENKTDI